MRWALLLPSSGRNWHVTSCESCLLSSPDTALHTHTARETQGQLTLASWCSRQGSFHGTKARLVLDYSLSIVTARSSQAENLYDFQKLLRKKEGGGGSGREQKKSQGRHK